MDINFVAAIYLINMGKYELAVEYLKKAIAEQENNGSTDVAIEYTCVLGELLANINETEEARKEFEKVVEYCEHTNSLYRQKEIAQRFLNEFETAGKSKGKKRKRTDEACAKPPASGNKPNTTQTSVFLQ